MVVCVEAKWAEAGMGRCSCRAEGGAPRTGDCAKRVLRRPAYWTTARDVFGLPERVSGSPCPLSFSYQAVANAAAARALAGPKRKAVFVLLYDRENPYFTGAGAWPGWAPVLESTLATSDLLDFRALSWQKLAPNPPTTPPSRNAQPRSTASSSKPPRTEKSPHLATSSR